MVSYDNLGILQVKGNNATGKAEEYVDILNNDPSNAYVAYVDRTSNTLARAYGRGFGEGFIISIDLLESKGICTINFDIDFAYCEWPAEGIAMVLQGDMYQNTKTVVPAYEYEGAQYYPSENGFGEAQIYCAFAPETTVADYTNILLANHWDVMDHPQYDGMKIASSRDKLVVLTYYHDGTGLQILIGFGEGENYSSWDKVIPAINDFGKTELRMTGNLAEQVPPITDAELYEIDRSARGILKITLYRQISYKTADIINYLRNANEDKFTWDVKEDYYWLLAKDNSFAVSFILEDYVDDTLITTTLVMRICDYRSYEGAYVYYGTWPTLQVNTIRNNISASLVVPAYEDSNATYYVMSDYKTTIKIDVLYGNNNAISLYKTILLDYSYTIKEENNGKVVLIDRNEVGKVTLEPIDNGMRVTLEKYVKSTVVDQKANISFKTISQISSQDQFYSSVTWSNGPVSFTVNKSTSSVKVGNEGDYISNPLRLYKDQEVRIATTEGKISKLEFYVVDAKMENGSINQNFDKSFLSNISISGATLDRYNAETVLVRFIVDPTVTEIVFSIYAPYMKSGGGFALESLDVYLAN